MALIDPGNITNGESSSQFWKDELENLRALLNQVDIAILKLTKNEIAEYTIDTGQTRQTVKRNDLLYLRSWRNDLITQIATLEKRLGLNGSSAVKVVPTW